MVDTLPHPSWPASWRCALATIVAVPFSFFGALYAITVGREVDNAAAVTAYLFLSLVLTLPLALANCFLVAPFIAATAHRRLTAAGSHLILVVVWAVLVLSEYFVVPRLPTALVVRLMLFWYLAILLGPAAIVGSFVYSLKYNSMRRKLTSCA